MVICGEYLRGKAEEKTVYQNAEEDRRLFPRQSAVAEPKIIAQVADEIGASDTSVLRFVREIGYDGYNALKGDLHSIITERVAPGTLRSRLDRRTALPAGQSFADGFAHMMHDAIENVFHQNNMAVFDQIVEQLSTANHKYIVGFRGCSGVAHFFARTLRYVINDVVEATSADVDSCVDNPFQRVVVMRLGFICFGEVAFELSRGFTAAAGLGYRNMI